MNNVDYDLEVAELVNGIPTANNQDGITLEAWENEYKDSSFYVLGTITDEYGEC